VIEEIQQRPLYAADVFQAPDLTEPVAAFRKWRVVDGRLRSLYLPVFWTEAVQHAECRALHDATRSHMAPGSACSCGLYASHEPDLEFPAIDYRGVSGVVTLWGDIEVHADGVRAEYAQVEALCLYDRWTDRQTGAVQAVAEELGVELVELDELERAAERYGRRLDPGLLGHLLGLAA
jgi:hypothetical protein